MLPRLVRLIAVALAVTAVLAAAGCRKGTSRQVKIAAAADLTKAFEEVGAAFTKETGIKPVFRFGSSGLLAQQLGEQAPFDVFAAANVGYIDDVVAKGACDGATKRTYARGRIAVWSKQHKVTSLAELADPKFGKIAIAHPEHAPYGKAAKQALEAAGIWAQVEPKLVFGENVRQTMQWAQEGEADAAIVALSLAHVTVGGNSFLIDESQHQPLIQALAVCKHGGAPANGQKFVDFLTSPVGVEIMKRYGFAVP